ncbi:HEPN domain-containing protein [Candidatus Woesearchaeota archaeon]|nr:HEPN domain-containing protein [Candidatus Woesearchaeota archaeon]
MHKYKIGWSKQKLALSLLKIYYLLRIIASENLTGTYFSSRYPGAAPEIPSKFYTLEKAKIHLHEAEEVIRWSKSMIQ